MGMKTRFRNYQINKLKKNPAKAKSYSGFAAVRTIGISFANQKFRDEIQDYKRKMEGLGKQVSIIEYIPFKRKEIEKKNIYTPEQWYCKSDLNYSGVPTNAHVQSFLQREYDVYLDLNEEEEHPNDFISLKLKASLKAGNSNRQDLGLDLAFSISEKDNLQHFFKQLDYYLNFINQK